MAPILASVLVETYTRINLITILGLFPGGPCQGTSLWISLSLLSTSLAQLCCWWSHWRNGRLPQARVMDIVYPLLPTDSFLITLEPGGSLAGRPERGFCVEAPRWLP